MNTLDVLRELAAFSFDQHRKQSGYDDALRALCRIRRNARLMLTKEEEQQAAAPPADPELLRMLRQMVAAFDAVVEFRPMAVVTKVCNTTAGNIRAEAYGVIRKVTGQQ